MSTNLGSPSLMTDLLHTFIQGATNGAANILPDALTVLVTLGTIELAVSLVFNKDQDPIMIITEKLLKFGFFGWLISNWATGMNISKQFLDTFQIFGIKAALGDGANGIVDPSGIIELGLTKTSTLLASIVQFSTVASVMGNLGLIIIKIGLLFLIMGCYGWMALQLFITYVEFYMTSTLTVILLPFGVNRYMSFVSEKAFGAVFSFCVKVMVLQFILCIGIPLAEQWVIEINNTDLTPVFRALFGCLGLAFLTWRAPDYIQGLLSGTPSFGAGDVVGGARAAVGGATAVASAPMRIAGFTQAAMNAPGGRNNNGSTNWSGTVSNMGTMLRQRMPDRQSELHNQVMFSNAKAMLKQQKARDAAKNQTNLFD